MIELDPKSTALVLIDLQNAIRGYKLAPVYAQQLLERGKALAEKFRAAGALVLLVNVSLSTDEPPRQVDELSPRPDKLPEGFVDPTPGLAQPGDLLITKTGWGAFFATDLDPELRRRGVRTIALGGAQFSVESTARHAWELGYELVIVKDATASSFAEPRDTSIEHIFPKVARVMDSTAMSFSRA